MRLFSFVERRHLFFYGTDLSKMKANHSNCTEVILGTIKNLRVKGQDCPTMITVEYQVNGTSYEITEPLKLKSEKIKLGFLPIGQKRVPVMGNTAVGNTAMVNYNPNNPSEAFITNNIGKATI